MKYSGNGIYNYINANNLNYDFRVASKWPLIYGNAQCEPLVFVFVSKTNDINSLYEPEDRDIKFANNLAETLKLPLLFVTYQEGIDRVCIHTNANGICSMVSYDDLKNLFQTRYRLPVLGNTLKGVNQYTSSTYHDWQRNNLGNVTVSDIDLVKYDNDRVSALIELKRSYISLDRWTPFEEDYKNFTLLTNTIVNSDLDIDLFLYYNLMEKGINGQREEDISEIKVFKFEIPNYIIMPSQLHYTSEGIFPITEVFAGNFRDDIVKNIRQFPIENPDDSTSSPELNF